ncbi:hypothetical protein Pmani_007436 [Petrolisthes manimaculis]|uniref:Uncharacterized protein n=1 Tax=Petrolisthes manimaculis TaxID=1843537 RepID=A0AAE1Q8M0_9EUCA|nr:hypothetical protein Pmani_007436 [Petrolisthes manimaculis]
MWRPLYLISSLAEQVSELKLQDQQQSPAYSPSPRCHRSRSRDSRNTSNNSTNSNSNFNGRYATREEPERSWGLKEANGQYSGIVGQLQREEYDMCTLITISPDRNKVMSHARAYPSDAFTLISLKPALLPKYLSFVRPFSSIVWSSLVIGAVVFGLFLLVIQWVLVWAINKVGGGDVGEKETTSTTSQLFIWAALVGQSSTEVSENLTGRSLTLEEAVEKIQQGSYSFITFKNQISIKIASFYTDSQGQTPFYISVGGVFTLPDYGWGFRRGAPFHRIFQHTFLQFGESGIVNKWFDELMASRVKTNREAAALKTNIVVSKESEILTLGLNHLQGAFYILFMGFLVTLFTLLVEILVYNHQH